MTAILRDDELDERFRDLNECLLRNEKFWRHHAFKSSLLPWENEFPELSSALRKLTLTQAEMLSAHVDQFIEQFGSFYSDFAAAKNLCRLGQFSAAQLNAKEPRDIPGRKWQQLQHFIPCIPENNYPVLEWCAGKAHLGRMLAQQRGCNVVALEFNEQIIAAGKLLATREQAPIEFIHLDVMSAAADRVVTSNQNAVALHACGDLHVRLLQLCAQAGAATITLAPCCYHLLHDEKNNCLSHTAKKSGLQLSRDDLRTAVHGTVTSSARQNRQRRSLQAWRLGFDQLQREINARDEYLPTPSLSTVALHGGFATFCQEMARVKQLSLPASVNYQDYEARGRQRLQEVCALDLPRVAFRRALEMWLVLDRALFLRENGYRVEVGEFCAASLTPRNLLIRAFGAN